MGTIDSKKSLCIGDGFVVNRGKPNYLFAKLHKQKTTSDVDESIEDQIVEFATTAFNEMNLGGFTECCFNDWFTTGNVPVLLQRTTVNNQKKFTYKKLEVKHFRLIEKENSSDVQRIAISPTFPKGINHSPETDYYNHYPHFEEKENGVSECIILIRNLLPGRTEYGLPVSMSSIFWQMAEGYLQQFINDDVDNAFLPKFFIEAVESEPSTEKEKAQLYDLMEAAWTMKQQKSNKKGLKKQRFVYREVEDKEMFSKVHEFSIKADEPYLSFIVEKAERIILASERWHKALLGIHLAGGLGLPKNELKNAYKMAKKNVITPSRNKVMGSVVNVILKEFFFWEKGIENLDHYLTLQDGFESMFLESGEVNSLTVNEDRQLSGFSPLPDDDERGNLLMTNIKSNERSNNS